MIDARRAAQADAVDGAATRRRPLTAAAVRHHLVLGRYAGASALTQKACALIAIKAWGVNDTSFAKHGDGSPEVTR